MNLVKLFKTFSQVYVVLYYLIMKIKFKQWLLNNSTNTNKTKITSHLKSLNIKNDHEIWRWKSRSFLVFTNTNKTKITSHLKPLNIKNDHEIWRWKSRSFLGKYTNIGRVKPVNYNVIISIKMNAMICVFSYYYLNAGNLHVSIYFILS